ncbi:MAG: hypothetical protein JSU06_05525 [Actinobacteria bacterium]|nr:hypothetical protein [Actinomycetota bacterium]
MRSRTLVLLVLTTLAAAATLASSATALPKAPKVTQYPVTLDVVGYLDYTWTYDNREKCSLGYAKTVEEHLGFELGRPRPTKVSIVNGEVMLFPVFGSGTVETRLSGWQTTNYCPPGTPAPEPPEPTCTKKLRSAISVGLAPVQEPAGPEDPTPLVHDVQIAVLRHPPKPQTPSCHKDRPSIASEIWQADPYAGIIAPLGANDVQFLKLGIGKRLKRTVEIGGGCGGATLRAHASAAIPVHITSCVLTGKVVVTIVRTGRGFG